MCSAPLTAPMKHTSCRSGKRKNRINSHPPGWVSKHTHTCALLLLVASEHVLLVANVMKMLFYGIEPTKPGYRKGTPGEGSGGKKAPTQPEPTDR